MLDNCEHVIEAAADAAECIVGSVPGVHVLSTSREPLRAAGERVYRLPPLESPSNSVGLTADEALTFPCVQLFMERVAASLGDYRLSNADAPLVAEICQKLDGIALAIELAAGRVAAFGVRELAGRLDDRFRLLTSGRRTALPRHQTLAATLDWSYELLPVVEQVLLRRLSIFAGEFSLDAAVAVMIGADTAQVIDHIADLVSKSLVVADWSAESVRYRLLDTTRLYSAEKLRGEGEFAEVCRAHANHLRELFRTAEPEAETLTTQRWRAKYASQIDNLRAALDWAGSPAGDPRLGVALVIAAVPLWVHLSLMGECRMWAERGLAMADGEDRVARMHLLAALGWSLMYAAGRADEIGATWAATLELADALDDASYRLRAIWGVWIGRLNRGDLNGALELAARLLKLVQHSSDQADLMTADRLMATTLHYRGDQDSARMYIERMFGRYSSGMARPKVARFQVDQQVTARYFQARILWLQGYVDQALQAVQRNIQEGEALGHALSFASVLGQGACPIALFTGDLAAARRYGLMLLDHSERHALHLWNDWARCFGGLVATREGDVQAGLEIMRETFDKAGDSKFLPRYMLLLGEYASAIGRSWQHRLGLETVEEMLKRCERTEERWYEPELIRVRGELLVLDEGAGAAVEIERHFIRAKELAARRAPGRGSCGPPSALRRCCAMSATLREHATSCPPCTRHSRRGSQATTCNRPHACSGNSDRDAARTGAQSPAPGCMPLPAVAVRMRNLQCLRRREPAAGMTQGTGRTDPEQPRSDEGVIPCPTRPQHPGPRSRSGPSALSPPQSASAHLRPPALTSRPISPGTSATWPIRSRCHKAT